MLSCPSTSEPGRGCAGHMKVEQNDNPTPQYPAAAAKSQGLRTFCPPRFLLERAILEKGMTGPGSEEQWPQGGSRAIAAKPAPRKSGKAVLSSEDGVCPQRREATSALWAPKPFSLLYLTFLSSQLSKVVIPGLTFQKAGV